MLDKNITANIDGDDNITIQGISDSTITINTNDPTEVRKFLIKFQEELNELPTKILDMLKSEEGFIDENLKGIKMNLSMGLVIPERATHLREGTLKLYLTNYEKIHRFCHTPYFKISKPLVFREGTPANDTFQILQNQYSQIVFPCKLEFGQQIIADFSVVQRQIEIYEQLDDGESYIQAFCSTTLGELFSSNKYIMSDFLKSYKEFLKPWE